MGHPVLYDYLLLPLAWKQGKERLLSGFTASDVLVCIVHRYLISCCQATYGIPSVVSNVLITCNFAGVCHTVFCRWDVPAVRTAQHSAQVLVQCCQANGEGAEGSGSNELRQQVRAIITPCNSYSGPPSWNVYWENFWWLLSNTR